MADKINDGGPAFAHFKEDAWGNARVVGGMSLRDHFAGQSLIGYLASENLDAPLDLNPGEAAEDALTRGAKERAEWCYRQADAMLKAREDNNADQA